MTYSGANIAFASRVAVSGSPCTTRDMDQSCRDLVLCRARAELRYNNRR